MTVQEALQTLRNGGELPKLAEAIGIVASEPTTSLEALMLGLKHRGFVAEQAALALYKRTFRPIPDDRRMLVTDPEQWATWLHNHGARRSRDSTIYSEWDGGLNSRMQTLPSRVVIILVVYGVSVVVCAALVLALVALYSQPPDTKWASITIAISIAAVIVQCVVGLRYSIGSRSRHRKMIRKSRLE